MPRTQFSLKTLLWLIVCAACFFGGMAVDRALLQVEPNEFICGVPPADDPQP